ncbi:hypothetical protein C9374_014367 [Naegleria lovaniensis]|uniref:ATP-grasp domain-containing protein n=1 Tax=Naegleria lovaniensis TaxID=51637 RepID=A0AA88GXP0_NAELO|nr:uncharacterized protein C9374_014367 [Naegleria lovaniensis]KAG2388967.1 hypothetical protein C9374_014367 [Naegleria lovaniensis]
MLLSFFHSFALYVLKFTFTLCVLCLTIGYQLLAFLSEYFSALDHDRQPAESIKNHHLSEDHSSSNRKTIQNILILGGRAPVALDYLRMFSEEGHQVHLAETPYYRPMFISNFSKFAKHVHYFTVFPNKDYETFETELLEMIKKYSITLIIPTCEEVFQVGRAKHRIEKETPECHVFCESIENLKELHNKFEFIEYIERELNGKFNNNNSVRNNVENLCDGRCEMENVENRVDENRSHNLSEKKQQGTRQVQFKAPKTILLSHKSTAEKLTQFWNECNGKIVLKPCYSRFASDTMVKPSKDQALNLLHSQIKECQSSWWVAQEFIEGQMICSFGVATKGILRAHTCYLGGIYTPNGTAVGSSVYFEPLENIQVDTAIQEWISQLVVHRKYTGQISFDLIVASSSTTIGMNRKPVWATNHSSNDLIIIYPIECNPRATSGAHLFNCDTSHVSGQLLRRSFTQCFLPNSTVEFSPSEKSCLRTDIAQHVSYSKQQHPSSTSSTHMAILEQVQTILKPLPGSRLQIIGGMFMPLWTGCKDMRSCFVWLRDLLACGIHRDVLFRANDCLPFFVQFYFILDPIIKTYRYGVGLLNSMTFDIEWNGEEY